MTIRTLCEGDLEALAELYTQFWGESSNLQKMKNTFADVQHNPAVRLLGAFVGGQLAGSVMGIVCAELYGDCRPFLVVEDMIVDGGFRRQGIGKALLAELEQWAREKDCAQMLLVTETDREDACRFYEAAGFDPARNKGFKKKIQ